MFEFVQTIDSIDKVPNDFRGLYAETEDGKYALRADDGGVKSAVSAITGLQQALKSSRNEVKDLRGKQIDLSELSDFGSSPSEIAEAFQAKLAEAGKGKKSVEETQAAIKAAQEALTQKQLKEKEAWEAERQALSGQLHNLMVTSEATSALAAAGAVKPEVLMPFIERQVKVVTAENGTLGVQVLDQDGNPRYSGTGTGPMTIRELVAEMKSNEADYGFMFKSEKPSGGGTPANRPRQAPAGQKRDEMSSLDKIQAGLAARRR